MIRDYVTHVEVAHVCVTTLCLMVPHKVARCAMTYLCWAMRHVPWAMSHLHWAMTSLCWSMSHVPWSMSHFWRGMTHDSEWITGHRALEYRIAHEPCLMWHVIWYVMWLVTVTPPICLSRLLHIFKSQRYSHSTWKIKQQANLWEFLPL